LLNNGEIVRLNPSSSSSVTRISGIGIGTKEIISEETLGARIANFLKVPFSKKRPPTVNEILSAVSSAVQSAVEKD